MNKFTRRAVLIGGGGIVVSLPFLESLRAYESTNEIKRFVMMFSPQGTIHSRWTPSGTENNFTLPQILSPLEPVKNHITVLSGISNLVAQLLTNSNGHNRAARTLLTAQPYSNSVDESGIILPGSQQQSNGLANGPSIDQYIAQKLNASIPYQTLNFGIGGANVNENQILFSNVNEPVGLEANPISAFDKLFGDITNPEASTTLQLLREQRKSVLDAVLGNFDDITKRVSHSDQIRLEAHADKIRTIEQSITNLPPPSDACTIPQLSLPQDYNYNNFTYDNYTVKTMIDLLVMALACNYTRVGTLQFTQYQAPTFPFIEGVNIPGNFDSWHTMIHEGQTSNTNDIATVMSWYMSQYAYLIEQLNIIDEGDGTLLDHTLTMSISEFGNGNWHATQNLPIILGGHLYNQIIGNKFYSYPDNTSTNDLFAGLLSLFDINDSCFGYSEFCSEPILLN